MLKKWPGEMSFGVVLIVVLAVGTLLVSAFRGAAPSDAKLSFWYFGHTHVGVYRPAIAEWNRLHPETKVMDALIGRPALERRLLSAFLADTPVADLVEVEIRISDRIFAGPLESVGLLDLTDRLKNEGLLSHLNAPSLRPWMSRGKIFGLPHDIHPVLLAYRADLIEAAGIDLSHVETWDDYFRAVKPLTDQRTPDGRRLHYALDAWDGNDLSVPMLFLQGGGQYFDEQGRPALDHPQNAKIAAHLVTWFAGPNQVATEAPESAAGHQMRLDGTILGTLMPDWRAGAWKIEIPGLAGKLKLMPLPAWFPGGRRTSVFGGTMLGIARASKNPDDAWRFAKHLYFSPKTAEAIYRATNIISPFKDMWTLPVYKEPDPYFCGQRVGTLYLAQAENVPWRDSSPFNYNAMFYFKNALIALKRYAIEHEQYDETKLLPEAQRLLAGAQQALIADMRRNPFLTQQ